MAAIYSTILEPLSTEKLTLKQFFEHCVEAISIEVG